MYLIYHEAKLARVRLPARGVPRQQPPDECTSSVQQLLAKTGNIPLGGGALAGDGQQVQAASHDDILLHAPARVQPRVAVQDCLQAGSSQLRMRLTNRD